jgi:hypothetical protein
MELMCFFAGFVELNPKDRARLLQLLCCRVANSVKLVLAIGEYLGSEATHPWLRALCSPRFCRRRTRC